MGKKRKARMYKKWYGEEYKPKGSHGIGLKKRTGGDNEDEDSEG